MVALTILEHLVKVLQMCHYDITVFLQNGQRNEDVEVAALVVGPECLPQPQHIRPFELAFVPNKQHAEEKEEVGRLG